MRVQIMTPPVPADEELRMAELESFDILDTLPEAAYEAITQLASHICDTPIALISVMDRDRQWFKSRVGIDVDETPRDLAFCAYAVADPDHMLVVPDATNDPRFAGNPFVTGDPEIRFYAGAPLVTQTGRALGTLCVIDRSPRTLTEAQTEALEALSVQVMALLELRRAHSELVRSKGELEEVMRQRDTFIATVSHEIRTPLTAVIGYIGLLTDPSAALSGAERAELMGTVGRQAGDVSHLIDDLLVAAKAESGSLQVQAVSVNLPAQAAQVMEGLDPQRVAGVQVAATPTRAMGDPARVRQVIRNLLTNAFRYGGDDVAVHIFDEGDRRVLEVSDDGSPIPEESVELIFQQFQRSSDGPVVSDSVGLGLPISRLIAEMMGGSLTHVRRDNRTVFRLELPADTSN